MSTQSVLLPPTTRYRLSLNPQLGAGNFLHCAHAVNSFRDAPLLHADVPFELLGRTGLTSLSIANLKEIADRYAAWYLARGVVPLDPVAVYCSEATDYLVQYVALTGIGAVPVLTNGALETDTAADYFQRVGVVGITADHIRHEALAKRFDSGKLKCFSSLKEISGGDLSCLPPWYPYRHDYDTPVMITHSSGTTGAPKAVVLQHGKWFHGIRRLLGLEVTQGAGRYLSALPASHNASIAYAIHALLSGAEIMLMSTRAGEAVAKAIERFRPETVVSFPLTYVELAELNLALFDLSSVTMWINSGDAAHETHIRRLVAHGYHYRGSERIPGSQFVDGLGSSEMGHSCFRIIHTPYTNCYDRCVGCPQAWVDPAVLDADGNPVPIGVVGRLGIKSPSITDGYWNDSLLTHRSRLRGYWLTGDLVYRDHLGCYYHVDRVSDAIPTTTGTLYSLQTEELILKNHQCLADCSVIGVIDQDTTDGTQSPIVLAVRRAGEQVDQATLLDEINTVQSAKDRPLIARALLLDSSEIPLGVTGKVLKRSLRDRFGSRSS